jgi:tetratricopeptide (TPR) repeat protein
MTRSARALAALLCLCALLAGTGAVEARGGARDRYQRGAKLFQKGLYAEALEEFEAAYKMQQLPRLLFKMAQAHLALGHGSEALSLYERFLQMEPKPPADIKAQVDQDTERAKAMVQAAEDLAARERAAKEPPPPPDPAPEPPKPDPSKPAPEPSPPAPETPRPAPDPSPASPAPAPVKPPAPPPEIARPAPPPRLVGGRPVGRVAAGVTLGGVGLALVGLGAGALSVDGKCGTPPVPPATECDQIFQSLVPGAAMVGVGAAVALTGALIWAWPVRRAR